MVLILQRKWVEYFTGVIQNRSKVHLSNYSDQTGVGVSNVYLTFFFPLENLQHSNENNMFFTFLLV